MASDSERESRTSDAEDTPAAPSATATSGPSSPRPVASRIPRPQMAGGVSAFSHRPSVSFADQSRSPTSAALSPDAVDRVFPIRSVVSVDPTPTPSTARSERAGGGYFDSAASARRQSSTSAEASSSYNRSGQRRESSDDAASSTADQTAERTSRQSSASANASAEAGAALIPQRHPPGYLHGIIASSGSVDSPPPSEKHTSTRPASITSAQSEDPSSFVTARFKHVVTDEGHAVITGRDGETIQRCEDEPIHIPGAIQGFGLLIALEEQSEGKLIVRVVSENSKQIIGYTPQQLFALESFTDILSEEQADNLLDHVDFIRDDDADIVSNGPEVFTMSIRNLHRKNQKLWCAMHINQAHPNLLICEFELEDDPINPLVPPNSSTPELAEDTLNSNPTDEEYQESTQNSSKPLRVLRSARKRKGEAAAMEVFNIMSQVQEQLAAAPNLDKFLKILVGVVKELTGFHRVMIYQFDQRFNGRVVTELVDPRATKDLYKGLNFPASDIPKQARDLYKINKVRMLYDRDQETARLVCRTVEDLEVPVDLTHAYLRAMSPIHIKYLANMAVRSSMSISINAFDELWGLIACHTYGPRGMRVSFPIRKMCRLVGDSASRNIERLSYASRLQARKLINTVPTQNNPSGYIIASSEDLLKLFDADFGLLSIRGETKILGPLEQSQEALAMLEYLRMRNITNVMTSLDIKEDFPDLRYPPGFSVIAGMLLVPLSTSGQDFIVFFRKGQLREVKWAGNPYEKFIREGTDGYLEPRKSFRTWSETVVGKCREWTEEEIETAAVLCLVYGKFIEVWRQKEAALQNSQLTRLLLANSAHEVRTPLNAIINYLEIALEGQLDQETRDNLAKSHSASKSLIYVINDLLDLTKTEEGADLIKDEVFDIKATMIEATDMFKGDAKRKGFSYEVVDHPGLPSAVIGDQRRVRQAISNVTANAIQNTTNGFVKVEMYLVSREDQKCELEVSVEDTGVGMSAKKLDQLFRELEQVHTEGDMPIDDDNIIPDVKSLTESSKKEHDRALGLGLAIVARIIKNMNGQLRLRSEEGKGSRFVIQLPFDLPDTEPKQPAIEAGSTTGSYHSLGQTGHGPTTPPAADEVTLIERGSAHRRGLHETRQGMLGSRKNSAESVNSRRSVKSGHSNLSFSSQHSGRSEADRLIEAIQEPHRVEGWHDNSVQRSGSGRRRILSAGSSRPRLEKRHTHTSTSPEAADVGSPVSKHDRPKSIEVDYGTSLRAVPPSGDSQVRQMEYEREGQYPGEALITDQGQPVRPVRLSDEDVVVPTGSKAPTRLSIVPAPPPAAQNETLASPTSSAPEATERMRVLVAEDDLVNSRIIKKRLERMDHEVILTVNGEDCATAYCDQRESFDIVLMDMQMPIVDGLTSTKMIRSHEKTHGSDQLSTNAMTNGRIPIIAVSASLVEKYRQTYIDAGFDGWILKPISFSRLSEIMKGATDGPTRSANLYQPGNWEHGGWFSDVNVDAFAADTRPSGEPPLGAPGPSDPPGGVKLAAATDDPFVKEEGESRQSLEQIRLAAQQGDEPADSLSVPRIERNDSSEETITASQPVASPQPMSPAPEQEQGVHPKGGGTWP